MNEADTCRKYVVPKPQAAGWENEPHSLTEQKSFTDGRILVLGSKARRQPQKRADYPLRYTRDFPLAVVEAKAAYKSPGDGLQQAKDFLHAYVIIDLFSRYVVGWMVAARECKHLAARLFAETVARHSVEPGLTVHSDRGAAMKSDTLAQLLATLGVDQSFSRPHVSDDNAFSEAHFKTLKYQPDYPGRFGGELHARGWLESFFEWHNDHHQHSGLALFTPAEVFFGRVAAVHAVRQAALDAAFARHPARFPNGAPRAALPPPEVHINPLEAITVSTGFADRPTSDLPGPLVAQALELAASRGTPRRSEPRPGPAASAPTFTS